MNNQRIKSEPLSELKFDRNRKRVKFCPCGKDNKDGKFAAYVDSDQYGYCHSCGETFLPELPKAEQWSKPQQSRYEKSKDLPQRKVDTISKTVFIQLRNIGKQLYNENHFIQWLRNPKRGNFVFDDNTMSQLIESYYLANSTKYKGWVLFPYIDIDGKIRDIKAMDYNPDTGKRIAQKNGDDHTRCHFIGKELMNNRTANTERCFYGEHRLRGNNKTARIFESEATATYAAPFYSNSICIATGGSNGCKWTEKSKCRPLIGRKVILHPDIDVHDDWEQKAELLRGYGISVDVSQLLKKKALEFAEKHGIDYGELVKQKYDLRDSLQNLKLCDLESPVPNGTPQVVQTLTDFDAPKQPEPITKPEPVRSTTFGSFVDNTGQLFIETPSSDTYTIYPTIEHYNKRLCLPIFQKRAMTPTDFFAVVKIDAQTLTASAPPT